MTNNSPDMTMGPESITSEVKYLTPNDAMDLLSRFNTHNRNIRQDLVNAYARDMINGQWRYLGDPIRFGTDDKGKPLLLDGQHRLLALAKSGQTLPFKVEHGYKIADQLVMDTGALRFLSDNLKLMGYANPTMLAAIARKLLYWRNFGHPSVKGGKVSYPEVMAVITDEKLGPALREAASFASSHARSGLILPSIIGLFHVVFSAIDSDNAEWFLRRVEDGADLPSDHQVMVLRRRLIRDLDNSDRGRMSDLYQGACLVIAWNAYRTNRKIAIIKLPTGGVTSTNFPQPV